MLIDVRLERSALRRWHLALIRRLSARPGTRVAVSWGENSGPALPRCVAGLFGLERRLAGLPDGASARSTDAEFAEFASQQGAAPDLRLDLTQDAPGASPTWRLLFDGAAGETGAVAALLAGRMPHVAIVDAGSGRVVASGRPGSETPGIVVAAFEDVLARTSTLISAALDGVSPQVSGDHDPAAIRCRAVSGRIVKTIGRSALRRVYQLLYQAPHWRIGWRRVDGPDVVDLGALPGTPWHDLADDGRRFYADPFPITVDGRTHLFMEEFEHRLGRGIISAVEFDETGPRGIPRPVLERDVHLSYPFVVAHAGEIWMVPESWQSGTIDLYRATRFPDGWVKERTLVAGVEASDATPFQHAGRWWMTATVRDGAGSFSDALHIWSADALAGPWRAHRQNPVLIDIAGARPAGRIVERGGRLVRPVQDCRDGYGAALALAEITRLDDEAFDQRVLSVIRPGPTWPGRRIHTLNRAGHLEFIDGSRLARRVFTRTGAPSRSGT